MPERDLLALPRSLTFVIKSSKLQIEKLIANVDRKWNIDGGVIAVRMYVIYVRVCVLVCV